MTVKAKRFRIGVEGATTDGREIQREWLEQMAASYNPAVYIDVVYQDDDDLVVICGRELLSDKYFPLVNKEQENSEKLAADMIISQKRMGGLQAVRAPFFPPNALLITRLDNLSIYWQEDTRRRSVIDNPKRDRIENFESVNEAYVVEDYRCAALVENIQIGDFSAAAAEAGA